MGVFVLTTADAVGLVGLMGTPPITIEVRAEPIATFDKHNPSRQRFGQLERPVAGMMPSQSPTMAARFTSESKG
jgi:hypothetical protein